MYGEFLCKAMDFVQGAILSPFALSDGSSIVHASGFHNYSKVLIKPLLNQEKQLNNNVIMQDNAKRTTNDELIMLMFPPCL